MTERTTKAPTKAAIRRALNEPPTFHTYGFPLMAELLTPREQNGVKIDHVTISEETAKFENLCMMMNGFGVGRVEAGTYARLVMHGGVMMSDTPMERRTNTDFLSHAHGHVLVFGLGLGMIVHAALAKPEVESVTVVENNPDVIALVEPSLRKAVFAPFSLTIEEGDAFTWKPESGRKFNTIYFDIWPNISDDNLPDMGRLLRRAAPWKDRSDPKLWVGCWMRDFLLAERRRDAAGRSWW